MYQQGANQVSVILYCVGEPCRHYTDRTRRLAHGRHVPPQAQLGENSESSRTVLAEEALREAHIGRVRHPERSEGSRVGEIACVRDSCITRYAGARRSERHVETMKLRDAISRLPDPW